jgi:hypothetical protein
MQFKDEVNDTQIAQLEKALAELPNKIAEIQVYEFGRDVVQSERSYDFGLVSVFANLDTLRRYQNHPEHLKVIDVLKTMCANIITVDFDTMDMETVHKGEPDPFFGLEKPFS